MFENFISPGSNCLVTSSLEKHGQEEGCLMENFLSFEVMVKTDGDTAYGACKEFNALFRIDLKTGRCTYLKMFPNEAAAGRRLYTSAVLVDSRIYFIPHSAKNVAVFDVNTLEIFNIHIKKAEPLQYPHYKPVFKFSSGVLYQDYFIYMICCTYPAIVRIDTRSGETVYYDEWALHNEYAFRRSVCVDGRYIYVSSDMNDVVLRFDMHTGVGRIYHVGSHNEGCWCICRVNDAFWLAPRYPGAVIKWNPENGTCEEFETYPEGFDGREFYFTKIYGRGEKIFLFPGHANMGITIDCKTGKMQDAGLDIDMSESIVDYLCELDGFYYFEVKGKEAAEYKRIELSTGKIEAFVFTFAENIDIYRRDYFEYINKNMKIFREVPNFKVGDFVDYLEVREIEETAASKGAQIYKSIVEDL